MTQVTSQALQKVGKGMCRDGADVT